LLRPCRRRHFKKIQSPGYFTASGVAYGKNLFFYFCYFGTDWNFFDTAGKEATVAWLAGATMIQPLAMVLVGLIPNCAASVAITELYLAGAITYGAALAGLCASGGLGLLVLAREEKDRKNIFAVIVSLSFVSVCAGYAAQLFL